MTKACKENNNVILNKILYIYYLLYFYKEKKNKMQVLINSGTEINIIILVHILKLGFRVCRTNIRV